MWTNVLQVCSPQIQATLALKVLSCSAATILNSIMCTDLDLRVIAVRTHYIQGRLDLNVNSPGRPH